MTLLIKNVKILGGRKDFGERSDIFVVGNKISAIGSFPQKSADAVLDGQGAYLSPGFIDVGSAADHYLDIFENPGQENLLAQGITTIVGGQCGFSLAPLLYGRLDMIRKWADTNKININWHTLGELFKNLGNKIGVNFATLTGHLTIRQEILGDADRELTQNEFSVLKKVITDSLKDGSAGISFGLEYSHGKGTPYKELRGIAEIVAKKRGLCGIHLRSHGEDIEKAVGEAVALAKDTGIKVMINHLSPIKEIGAKYRTVLEGLGALPKDLEVYFNLRPFEENIVPLYFFLPGWAQKGSLENMLAPLKDELMSAKIVREFPKFDPEKVVVLNAVRNDVLNGKTIKEIMEIYGIADQNKALQKLMVSTGLRATLSYADLDKERLFAALKHDRSLIATHAPKGSASYRSAFMHFLELSEKEELMTLEDAIKKITLMPAKLFNLRGRGEVTEGNFADLVAFKNNEVKFTVVNGEVAFHAGQKIEKLFGRPLIRDSHGL